MGRRRDEEEEAPPKKMSDGKGRKGEEKTAATITQRPWVWQPQEVDNGEDDVGEVEREREERHS